MAISRPSMCPQPSLCRTAEGGPGTIIAGHPSGVAEAGTQLGSQAGSGLREGRTRRLRARVGPGRPCGRAASGRTPRWPGRAPLAPSQASHRDPGRPGGAPGCMALGKVQALPPACHRDAEKAPHPAVPNGPRKTVSRELTAAGACSGSLWLPTGLPDKDLPVGVKGWTVIGQYLVGVTANSPGTTRREAGHPVRNEPDRKSADALRPQPPAVRGPWARRPAAPGPSPPSQKGQLN